MHSRSRTGRKGPYAAYYVQIAPGNSFVGECFLIRVPVTKVPQYVGEKQNMSTRIHLQ